MPIFDVRQLDASTSSSTDRGIITSTPTSNSAALSTIVLSPLTPGVSTTVTTQSATSHPHTPTTVRITKEPTRSGTTVADVVDIDSPSARRGAIVGGVIGGLAIVIAVIVTWCWVARRSYLRRRWQKRHDGWRNFDQKSPDISIPLSAGLPPSSPTPHDSLPAKPPLASTWQVKSGERAAIGAAAKTNMGKLRVEQDRFSQGLLSKSLADDPFADPHRRRA